MKRYGNLYEKIYDIENIRLAHHNARKGKKHYDGVGIVDANPEYYFEQIHKMLKDKTFRNAPYHIFKRKFGTKEREIFKLPYFPDRIIHHCIMQIMEPIWKKSLIRDTYSSIKNRGLHDGVKRVKKALKDQEGTKFCLKLDIKKFYPSVDHNVLKQIIRKKIKCPDTLWLLDEIIDSTPGIPIGNYLSQYFGNIYLSGLDHFIKETLQVKYHFRYCDDLVLFASTKTALHQAIKAIKEYCSSSLLLSLKSSYQIYPVDIRGVDFLGYRFFHGFVLLRKSIVKNFKIKTNTIRKDWEKLSATKVINGLMSYYGWIKHADCKRLFDKYVNAEIKNIVGICCAQLKQNNPLMEVAP
jgi:hypothetical protein